MSEAGEKIEITRSSGNVFEDLGLPNPAERMARAKLLSAVMQQIQERSLTSSDAAELLNIEQEEAADLLQGKLSRFDFDRLLRYLNLLGCNVEIMVKPLAQEQGRTVTTVAA